MWRQRSQMYARISVNGRRGMPLLFSPLLRYFQFSFWISFFLCMKRGRTETIIVCVCFLFKLLIAANFEVAI